LPSSLELDSEEACALAYRLRLESGMTQAALAHATGLSVSTISRYETGRSTPSRRTLERLASGAGVSLAAAERGLAAARRRLGEATSFPPLPPALSYPAGLGQDEARRLISETLRSPRFRSLSPEPGEDVDLDDLLPPGAPLYPTGLPPVSGRATEGSPLEDRPWLMMRKAIVHHALGDDRKAAEELSFATLTLSGSNSAGPRFVFYLTRIAYLLAAGHAEGARNLLPGLEEAARSLPPPGEALRLRWVRARVAGALGQPARQAALLRELEADFTELEMPLETLCAWADRIALELEEPRPEAARQKDGAPAWALASRGLNPTMAAGLETLDRKSVV
jgi:transcriptional regulator with XRE-family HTH domain